MGEVRVNVEIGPQTGAGVRVHAQPGAFAPRIEVLHGTWAALTSTEAADMLDAAEDSATAWDSWAVAYFGAASDDTDALRDDVIALADWPAVGTCYARLHVGDVGFDRSDTLTASVYSAAVAGGSTWTTALASSALHPVTGQTVSVLRDAVLYAAAF